MSCFHSAAINKMVSPPSSSVWVWRWHQECVWQCHRGGGRGPQRAVALQCQAIQNIPSCFSAHQCWCTVRVPMPCWGLCRMRKQLKEPTIPNELGWNLQSSIREGNCTGLQISFSHSSKRLNTGTASGSPPLDLHGGTVVVFTCTECVHEGPAADLTRCTQFWWWDHDLDVLLSILNIVQIKRMKLFLGCSLKFFFAWWSFHKKDFK